MSVPAENFLFKIVQKWHCYLFLTSRERFALESKFVCAQSPFRAALRIVLARVRRAQALRAALRTHRDFAIRKQTRHVTQPLLPFFCNKPRIQQSAHARDRVFP